MVEIRQQATLVKFQNRGDAEDAKQAQRTSNKGTTTVTGISFPLRSLRGLCVSAVKSHFTCIQRRDAEVAEVAQRISNQATTVFRIDATA